MPSIDNATGVYIPGYGSSGKGRSNLSPEIVEAHLLLDAYRHALVNGLGASAGDYTVACIPKFAGIVNAGVAVRLTAQTAYLLIDGTGRSLPEYLPTLLAKEISTFLQTRVVPHQSTKTQMSWEGSHRGPIIAYRFKLADYPTRLPF